MTRKIQSGFLALAVAVGGLFVGSPAQAGRPHPRYPYRSAYAARSQPSWSGFQYGVPDYGYGYGYGWGYGFAPYLYYNAYGFGGIQGAPNASPLRYGVGGISFGSSGYALDASELGF